MAAMETAPGVDAGDARLPVTVLSGFLGAGKTTLLSRILNNRAGLRVCLIVNDMSEVNVDAALVKSGEFALSRVNEKLVQLQNGCICCTLREDLLSEVYTLAKAGTFDYLVIEGTGIAEPLPVAETFTFDVPGYNQLSDIARLDTMVTVVDCFHFGKDIRSGNLDLSARFEGAVPEADQRTVVDLLVDQIEFCNVAVLNKIEMCTPEEVALVEGVVRKLNPDAVIYKTSFSDVPLSAVINTGLFSFQKAVLNSGWLKEVRGTHVPETLEYGISSFVYRRRRPFHPERLFAAVDDIHGVIRSKGWFWLATQNGVSGEWSHAGEVFYLNPGGPWFAALAEDKWPIDDEDDKAEVRKDFDADPAIGDRRQELVFIGIVTEYSQPAIEAMLDACLLTDEEMALGPDGWAAFPDPFYETWAPALGEGEGEDEGEDGDGGDEQECDEDGAASAHMHVHRHAHGHAGHSH